MGRLKFGQNTGASPIVMIKTRPLPGRDWMLNYL